MSPLSSVMILFCLVLFSSHAKAGMNEKVDSLLSLHLFTDTISMSGPAAGSATHRQQLERVLKKTNRFLKEHGPAVLKSKEVDNDKIRELVQRQTKIANYLNVRDHLENCVSPDNPDALLPLRIIDSAGQVNWENVRCQDYIFDINADEIERPELVLLEQISHETMTSELQSGINTQALENAAEVLTKDIYKYRTPGILPGDAWDFSDKDKVSRFITEEICRGNKQTKLCQAQDPNTRAASDKDRARHELYRKIYDKVRATVESLSASNHNQDPVTLNELALGFNNKVKRINQRIKLLDDSIDAESFELVRRDHRALTLEGGVGATITPMSPETFISDITGQQIQNSIDQRDDTVLREEIQSVNDYKRWIKANNTCFMEIGVESRSHCTQYSLSESSVPAYQSYLATYMAEVSDTNEPGGDLFALDTVKEAMGSMIKIDDWKKQIAFTKLKELEPSVLREAVRDHYDKQLKQSKMLIRQELKKQKQQDRGINAADLNKNTAKRFADIRNLIYSNPQAVGEYLINHPEYAEMICSIYEDSHVPDPNSAWARGFVADDKSTFFGDDEKIKAFRANRYDILRDLMASGTSPEDLKNAMQEYDNFHAQSFEIAMLNDLRSADVDLMTDVVFALRNGRENDQSNISKGRRTKMKNLTDLMTAVSHGWNSPQQSENQKRSQAVFNQLKDEHGEEFLMAFAGLSYLPPEKIQKIAAGFHQIDAKKIGNKKQFFNEIVKLGDLNQEQTNQYAIVLDQLKFRNADWTDHLIAPIDQVATNDEEVTPTTPTQTNEVQSEAHDSATITVGVDTDGEIVSVSGEDNLPDTMNLTMTVDAKVDVLERPLTLSSETFKEVASKAGRAAIATVKSWFGFGSPAGKTPAADEGTPSGSAPEEVLSEPQTPLEIFAATDPWVESGNASGLCGLDLNSMFPENEFTPSSPENRQQEFVAFLAARGYQLTYQTKDEDLKTQKNVTRCLTHPSDSCVNISRDEEEHVLTMTLSKFDPAASTDNDDNESAASASETGASTAVSGAADEAASSDSESVTVECKVPAKDANPADREKENSPGLVHGALTFIDGEPPIQECLLTFGGIYPNDFSLTKDQLKELPSFVGMDTDEAWGDLTADEQNQAKLEQYLKNNDYTFNWYNQQMTEETQEEVKSQYSYMNEQYGPDLELGARGCANKTSDSNITLFRCDAIRDVGVDYQVYGIFKDKDGKEIDELGVTCEVPKVIPPGEPQNYMDHPFQYFGQGQGKPKPLRQPVQMPFERPIFLPGI